MPTTTTQPDITWAGTHPCTTKSGQQRCLRCAATTMLYATRCAPGLPVHVTPGYPGGYWAEQLGYPTPPPLDGHPDNAVCPMCYTANRDTVARTVTTSDISRIRRAVDAKPGDAVYCATGVARVLARYDYAAHQHHARHIRADFVVRQVITTHGSRWFGHEPGGRYRGAECGGDSIQFCPGQSRTFLDN